MKLKFLLLLCMAGCASIKSLSPVKSAMTFNIRYDNPGDGENRWDNRKEELVGLLAYYHPDVFGLQEGLVHQLQYVQENLKEYRMIGVGRDDGKEKGEYTAIFYDTTKLKLLEQSTFWLSDTVDRVSKGWDAALERICTYGLFQQIKGGKQVYVFNTHYDHIGKLARVNSSKLLVKKIGELNQNNIPVILMGDFNSTPEEEPIRILSNDLVNGGSTGIYGPLGTFNGFDKHALLENRIDFIFTKGLSIQSYRHIDDKMKNGNCVSDHLPVLIEFR